MVRRVINYVQSTYERYERIIAPISLIGGFIFDILTLQRVDTPIENILTFGRLLLAAVSIILINLNERLGKKTEFSIKAHFWLTILIQFSIGGLLSTFLVFYYRSGTISSSWPFLLILALLFTFNELFKHHYSRLIFQISILYISVFSFFIFLIPVLIHKMGNGVFLLSGLASLIFISLFVLGLRFITNEQFKKNRLSLGITILSIYVIINILYFTNIIPPIPLSLKDGGVYHSIVKTADGKYEGEAEPTTWLHYFKTTQDYYQVAGEPVYAYSAVFSPTDLNTSIVHRWQQYDDVKKIWVTKSVITLPITGGRGDGFRTYSTKLNVTPGLWRVDVETPNGKDVGRIKFNIIESAIKPLTEKVELE